MSVSLQSNGNTWLGNYIELGLFYSEEKNPPIWSHRSLDEVTQSTLKLFKHKPNFHFSAVTFWSQTKLGFNSQMHLLMSVVWVHMVGKGNRVRWTSSANSFPGRRPLFLHSVLVPSSGPHKMTANVPEHPTYLLAKKKQLGTKRLLYHQKRKLILCY